MKRTLLSVKELAQELGISTDSVYRAYRKWEISTAQINRMIRFNLEKVHRAMEKKAKAMPNSQRLKRRATAGQGRRRAQHNAPVR
jgi:excisionase family DNA binding protein